MSDTECEHCRTGDHDLCTTAGSWTIEGLPTWCACWDDDHQGAK